MKNLTVPIDDAEYEKLGFQSSTISFATLKEVIGIEYAKEAFIKCNQIAQSTDLAKLTPDEIEAEINAVRNAKNSN